MLGYYNRLVINLYLIAMLLSIYLPLKDAALYFLVLLDIYFFALFLFDLKSNAFRINLYAALVLVTLVTSAIMSGLYSYYALINILVLCAIYYMVKFDSGYLLSRMSVYIFISCFVNLCLYYTFEPSYEGGKLVGDVIVERSELSFLPLSIASLIALLAFILSDSVKSIFFMYVVKLSSVALLFKLGKLSTVLTLIIVYTAVFLLKFFYKKGFKYVIDVFLVLLYGVFFSSAFIIYIFRDSIPSDIIVLLTRRDQIYSDFVSYTVENYGLLFGNGFINNFVHVSDVTTSAHNQYLQIFFVSGTFGIVIFFLFFVKVLKKTMEAVEIKNYMPFKVFFALSILMTMDNYFILTVFPLSMIFMMIFLFGTYAGNEYVKIERIRKVIEVKNNETRETNVQ